MPDAKCVLCGTPGVTYTPFLEHSPVSFIGYCGTCGDHGVTHRAQQRFQDKDTPRNVVVNCIADNIRASGEDLYNFWHVTDGASDTPLPGPKWRVRNVEVVGATPISHATKPLELIRTLGTKLRNSGPFSGTPLTLRDLYLLKMDGYQELAGWAAEIIKRGWAINDHVHAFVQSRQLTSESLKNLEAFPFSLTPTGWTEIERHFGATSSRKAFIAMSFTYKGRPAIQSAIESACTDAGWEAFAIDGVEYRGGVTDEILARIRQSRFIVAEYTMNKRGVYYEAGYAEGRNIPVISVVHERWLRVLHFDVKHLNFITWSSPDELRRKLASRIKHIIE